MLTRRSLLLAAPAFALMGTASFAKTTPVFATGGVAIRGADPVAYFTDGKPVIGNAAYSHAWSGATWHFASATNRDLFAATPEAYAPQFGGNCSWAVSRGYLASTVPEAWRIVDGKLYMNYSRSIQRRWERDIQGNITKGNSNWPGLVG